MKNNLIVLEPHEVWRYFSDILSIPRPSRKEQRIASYLIDFARKHRLEYAQDEAGNIVIRKSATSGMEDRRMVCLQSHMDMVCEKNKDKTFDFDTDAIVPIIDGDWVKADGTTLGADDGIGMAIQLAILASDQIEHGPLECLFTVDEETGLTGAKALQPGFLKSDLLINLDSEDEGQIFIGCAGGRDTVARLKLETESFPEDHAALRISVKGLKGGHSGDDINKGLANAIKLLIRLLYQAIEKFGIRIHEIHGGNLRNAIPRESEAVVVVRKSLKDELVTFVNELGKSLYNEVKTVERDLAISCADVELPGYVLSKNLQQRLVLALYACPHGVLQMSRDIQGFVETSTNLASIKLTEDVFIISTSQRSSISSALDDAVNMVSSVFHLAGADVSHSDGYPGWTPNPDSLLLEITKNAYKKLFHHEPQVLVVHAGLECGLIGEKFPGMDMVSIGPDIKGAHSPEERLLIPSVQNFWKWLLEILQNIPVRK